MQGTIIKTKTDWLSLFHSKNYYPDMVKAVVDIKREIIAVEAEWHADIEALLLSAGSDNDELWGINLFPDKTIEFNSLINIRPHLNNRSMDVVDKVLQDKISMVVQKWLI